MGTFQHYRRLERYQRLQQERNLFRKWRRLSKKRLSFPTPTKKFSTKFRPRRRMPSQRTMARRKITTIATIIISATATTTAGGGAKGERPRRARKAARLAQRGKSPAPDQRANAASRAASRAANRAANRAAKLVQNLAARSHAAERRSAPGARVA